MAAAGTCRRRHVAASGGPCYDPPPAEDPWCSGPTCQPVTLEIAGSNPVGSASFVTSLLRSTAISRSVTTRLVIFAVVALLAAACGSSTPPTTAPGASVRPSAPASTASDRGPLPSASSTTEPSG